MSLFSVDRGASVDEGRTSAPSPDSQRTHNADIRPRFPRISSNVFGSPVVESKDKRGAGLSCFNCLGAHNVAECPDAVDQRRVAANRRKSQQSRGATSYKTSRESMANRCTAGVIGEELRIALGLADSAIPSFVHAMRAMGMPMGYPPGWMMYAAEKDRTQQRIKLVTLAPDDDLRLDEDGELSDSEEATAGPSALDSRRFVKFLGFNHPGATPPKGDRYDYPKWSEFRRQLVDRHAMEMAVEKEREEWRAAQSVVQGREARIGDRRAKHRRLDEDDAVVVDDAKSAPPADVITLEDDQLAGDAVTKAEDVITLTEYGDSMHCASATIIPSGPNDPTVESQQPSASAMAEGIVAFEEKEEIDLSVETKTYGRLAFNMLREAGKKNKERMEQRMKTAETKRKWAEKTTVETGELSGTSTDSGASRENTTVTKPKGKKAKRKRAK